MIPQFTQFTLWAATEAETIETIVPNWMKILIAAGVFLIPYGLGVFLARQLKLKEYAFKISVVLFAATLGILPFAYQYLLGAMEQKHYKAKNAEWEAKQKERTITDADMAMMEEHFKENKPDLKINRPYVKPEEDTSISGVGEPESTPDPKKTPTTPDSVQGPDLIPPDPKPTTPSEKPEPKPETKPTTPPEKPEPKPETKPTTPSEKPEPKPEAKPTTPPEKPEPKPEAKPTTPPKLPAPDAPEKTEKPKP